MNVRTNALDYLDMVASVGGDRGLQLPFTYRLRKRLRRMIRLGPIDDFDWQEYNTHYRAEASTLQKFFTTRIEELPVRFADGQLWIPADAKPIHPVHRCLWEAILNLPQLRSVAEIGVGNGHLLSALRILLGSDVTLAGFDISERQIAFLREQHPTLDAEIGILDLTLSPTAKQFDCVYESTVLMHIQRPQAYHQALENLLKSASRFAVIIDNWLRHDYVSDVLAMQGTTAYVYDSGAMRAIVVSRDASLGAPFRRLQKGDSLLDPRSASRG